MERQKKNEGCLGSLVYLIFLMMAFGIVISLSFYGIIIVGAVLLTIYFFKFIAIIVKKVYSNVKRKYEERAQSGEPTFIRKFLDMLNMDNWGKESDIKDSGTVEIVGETAAEDEMEVVITENVDNEIEELVQRIELQLITIEENIANSPMESIEEKCKPVVKTVIKSSEPKTVEEKPKPQHRCMSQYDIERFA